MASSKSTYKKALKDTFDNMYNTHSGKNNDMGSTIISELEGWLGSVKVSTTETDSGTGMTGGSTTKSGTTWGGTSYKETLSRNLNNITGDTSSNTVIATKILNNVKSAIESSTFSLSSTGTTTSSPPSEITLTGTAVLKVSNTPISSLASNFDSMDEDSTDKDCAGYIADAVLTMLKSIKLTVTGYIIGEYTITVN